jgi:hypothetical protein
MPWYWNDIYYFRQVYAWHVIIEYIVVLHDETTIYYNTLSLAIIN